ncbi:RDD family protein [Streptomyces sp. NRRL S-4]|uniref:RDD family protein n=1 Tax=Streptomyces sp. NRRL S-4 TaxID=1519471 RepID=UPI0006B662A7|nr:RDD family protein [Streptomyces sp. NRRL S-4]KPC81307.1 RDD domain-containing membrane protein [Streptomyces sp. NRRL S-4]
MSNEPPPPPPDDDPFSKRPPQGPPPPGGSPYGSGPPPPPPPQDPYGGGGPYGGADPLAGMPPLAEPGKRILARLIDFLIISIPLYLISLPFGGAVDVTSDDGNDDFGNAVGDAYSGHQLVWSLIGLVVYVAYDTYFTRKDGRTIGKRLLKMRVAMLNDGSVPDTSSSLMRAVVLWLPALLCCPCLWWLINIVLMFTDKPYRQGLQDKAGKTVVVSAP